MTNQNLEKYDFQKPTGLSIDNGDLLKQWTKAFAILFKEKWAADLPSEIEVNYDSDAAFSFVVLKSRLPKPALAIRVLFGTPEIESFMLLEQTAVISIVMEMMGDTVEEIEDRMLSSVEVSLFEMFIDEVISSLSESWVDQESLPMSFKEIDDRPHRSRAFDPKTIMLQLKFVVKQGDKSFDLFWIVPQGDFEDMLAQFSEVTNTETNTFREVLECHAKEMKVKISVLLGGAELSFNQMSKLAAGDVILLDQKISEPLPVFVEDSEKFKAWPGRHGNSQAIKISSTV